jgi:SH3-like domain-containing protein
VNPSSSFNFSRWALALALAATAGIAGCSRHGHRGLEVAYVSAPQASLRDQVAAVYSRTGTVKNGERVEILDREKRFARVRTTTGLEGWIEQRYLVDQKTYDGLEKLTRDHQNDSVQAPGILRNETNLHITPGRETEHLYQLSSGAKVSILRRDTAEKQLATVPAAVAKPSSRPGAKVPAGPALEDWWLVRDAQGRVGWVLSRMVDVDVPLDIAQYAEGQRFVAFFVLNEVEDRAAQGQTTKLKAKQTGSEAGSTPGAFSGTTPGTTSGTGKVPQYLCILTEPRDGLPYDYDQIRVFTWNVKRHRYETAYREHGLSGVLPVTVSNEEFDKEGTLPVFVLLVKDASGEVKERKYKLNTPMVRRVLAPGEQKEVLRAPRRRNGLFGDRSCS